MKRENFLIGLVLLLVVLNAFMLFRMSSRRGPGGGPPPHDRIIVSTLNFDERQQQAFEKLKFEHRGRIIEIEDKFESTLEKYFLLLPNENQKAKDSLELIIAELEREKADVTFDHFRDLRNLCRPDQQKAFDEFIPQLFRFILPSSHRKH